jgi:hypothetical protein
MPDTVLNRVVLPAPFGPISACSVRSFRSRLASDTATNPSKRLVTPAQLRIAPSAGAWARMNAGIICPVCGVTRAAIAPFTVFLRRNGASTRSPMPTSPEGENRMNPMNSRPNQNCQAAVYPERISRNMV